MALNRLLDLLQAAALSTVMFRLLPGARRMPALEPVRSVTTARVSVIIPARNEALRIQPCLRALQTMQEVGEVIVVDDESSDETANVSELLGARVILGAPLPDGWVGKPWALHQGIAAATYDHVVCLDADTVPREGLIPALLQELQQHDIVSLAPSFLTSSFAEQGLHASMLAGLVYRFGAVGTQPASLERIYGNGQCLAFSRAWFINEGGFALAASEMNDDIALLRALAARSARISFRDGRNLLEVRMYESACEVWAEWGRSLPMIDLTSPGRRLFDLATLWLVLALPAVRTGVMNPRKIDLACIVLRVGMAKALAPSYSHPRHGVYVSPLFDILATLRLTQATCAPVRTWRGRRYTR
jgi:dolichol-phosphate mannosyltransferase